MGRFHEPGFNCWFSFAPVFQWCCSTSQRSPGVGHNTLFLSSPHLCFIIVLWVDQRIKFYSQNTNLLPPKPKSTFRHLKQGIQDFHRKYVLVPADKATNNVVVVWQLHYINTLKQELSGTKAYKETSEEEKSVVNGHCNHLALKFSVCVKERQDRLPTMYWLPKLHKRPYKARFIANSSSCSTTELSKLLTSCLTAVKNHVIRYCENVYERSGKNLFWSIKNSGEVLNKLKSRGFRATSLSTYDFSTLYTTLPHNLIKEKLINLIEWSFKSEGSPYIACNERQVLIFEFYLPSLQLVLCRVAAVKRHPVHQP